MSNYLTLSVSNSQGFDIYSPYLIQFRSGGNLSNSANLYSITDGSALKTGMSIQSGHGNTASFSDTFYDESDMMPILYCCNDVDRPTLRAQTSVTVNRITSNNTATLLKTILFNHPVDSYWGYACFDFENEIAYTVGLTGSSYTSDLSGANKVIVTKWDMSNLTDNGDGTYNATYISHYERDFIYVMQGMQFRDGIIWISSGYSDTSHPQMVYGMDAETGEMLYSIPTGLATEIEGIAWLDDYHLVVGFMGGTYKLMTFGTT